MKRLLAAAAVLLASLALPAAARAFDPPEVFVKLQPWDTHEAVSDWIPLASAPALDYVGGYQIGFRLQTSGAPAQRQRVAMTINAVPDGAPTQPHAAPAYCGIKAGTPGTIYDAAPEMQFEGSGTYTITVAIGPETGDTDDCLTGPATTGSFTVTTRVAPQLVGSPLSFRSRSADGFVGIRAADPPGGQGDLRCALGDVPAPQGLVVPSEQDADEIAAAHPSLPETVFTRPGRWSCFARGAREGQDDNFDTVLFGTPWSPPLPVDVRSDFRRKSGKVAKRRAKRPRFTFKAEWPAESAGGKVKVVLYRLNGCDVKKAATYRGTFTAKGLKMRMRRPRKPDYYFAQVRFGGTRLIRRSTDPKAVLLLATKRKFGFAGSFPGC